MPQPILIKSPKATAVRALLASSGSTVVAGQPLFELHDFEEQKILQDIDRLAIENEVKIAEVSGGFPLRKLEGLTKVLDARHEGLDSAAIALKATQAGYEVGTKTMIDVLEAKSRVVCAGFRALQASVEIEIYRKNIEDSATVYQLMSNLLAYEKSYVKNFAARLSIKAPVSGQFVSYVGSGAPVRRGHLLGELR